MIKGREEERERKVKDGGEPLLPLACARQAELGLETPHARPTPSLLPPAPPALSALPPPCLARPH